MSTDGAAEALVKIARAQIQGSVSQGVVANFLGVQYASIKQRFRASRLLPVDELGEHVDARAYGPRCPQRENPNQAGRAHLFADTPPWAPPRASELECLNLNIYTPLESLHASKELPVIVWIHGGGFVFGSAGPEFDGNYLVKHSIQQGRPVVLVTINYRLGYYGFLASRELRREAEADGEHYCPNQGLYDQRVALQWVKKYIHYFGGSGSYVTIIGQSAGGFSTLSHLVSNLPLCRAGIVMSSPVDPFTALDEAQQTFDRLVKSTGSSLSAPDSEKLAKLRNLTFDQMEELLKREMLLRPVWDAAWFAHQKSATPLERTAKFADSIEAVAVGWTADEMETLKMAWASWTVPKLLELLEATIPNLQARTYVIETYKIKGTREETLNGLISFVSDVYITMMPKGLSEMEFPICLYRFDQVDDTEGSALHGTSYHCLDNAYLFRMPELAGSHAPKTRKATADLMSEKFLKFVYGEQAWEPFRTNRKVMRFDGTKSGLVDTPYFERLSQILASGERDELLATAPSRMMHYMSWRR